MENQRNSNKSISTGTTVRVIHSLFILGIQDVSPQQMSCVINLLSFVFTWTIDHFCQHIDIFLWIVCIWESLRLRPQDKWHWPSSLQLHKKFVTKDPIWICSSVRRTHFFLFSDFCKYWSNAWMNQYLRITSQLEGLNYGEKKISTVDVGPLSASPILRLCKL